MCVENLDLYDKMELADIEQLYIMKKKEIAVSEIVNLDKIGVRADKNLFYVYVKRKYYSAKTRDSLIDKIYNEFYAPLTINSFYEEWENYKINQTATTDKTIRENRFLYNANIKNDPIADKPLVKLKPLDFIEYFERITKDRALTKQTFINTKSVLNGLIYYAIRKDIISVNPINNIETKNLPFKATNKKIIPYTESERNAIIEYAKQSDSLIDLAIAFDFYFTLRIGEVKGLKWSDIHEDYILVERFIDDKNNVIDHIKGNTNSGIRYLYIHDEANQILTKIKSLNSDPEYIFYWDGHNFSTATFNRHLKKICNHLHIEYRSSHKMRFSTASILYKHGVNETELQDMLGHSCLETTHHYLRNIATREETAQKVANIL